MGSRVPRSCTTHTWALGGFNKKEGDAAAGVPPRSPIQSEGRGTMVENEPTQIQDQLTALDRLLARAKEAMIELAGGYSAVAEKI